jgi:3-hydroxyacyl-[acyl-carrier-protein] dehydratase
MAQAADVLLLSCERYAGTIPYFIGIDDVKFKRKIEPGDTITIVAEIYKENLEKAIVTCDCVVYNKDEVATTGKVTLAMR